MIDLTRYEGVRTAVLGGTGFLGRWVARELADRGARVTLLVRDPAGVDVEVRGEVTVADVTRPGAVEAFLSSSRPSVTFNCIGYGVDRGERDPDVEFRLNAELVVDLCDAVARHRDRSWPGNGLVHLGSGAEYGPNPDLLTEDGDPWPTTGYGRSKLEGTKAVLAAGRTGVKGVVARAFTVYGPGEHDTRLLPTLVRAATSDEAVPLTAGTQARDFTYVGDVVDGLLLLGLAATAAGQVVNVATGALTTVRRFAETAAEELGLPADRLAFGALPARGDDLVQGPPSIDRLRRLTGWAPTTSIRDGVRLTIVRLRSNPTLALSV